MFTARLRRLQNTVPKVPPLKPKPATPSNFRLRKLVGTWGLSFSPEKLAGNWVSVSRPRN